MSKEDELLDWRVALWEIMRLDPMGEKLTALLLQFSKKRLGKRKRKNVDSQITELCEGLRAKYGVTVYIPPVVWEGAAKKYMETGGACWFVSAHPSRLSYDTNWLMPGYFRLVQQPDGPYDLQTPDSHPLPQDGESPCVTFSIPLDGVTMKDESRIKQEVWHIVASCLQALPKGLESNLEIVCKATKTPAKKGDFYRDLARYKKHAREGLTFSEIAIQEAAETRKKSSADSVERSVKRVRQAIYREPYYARRRRLDNPAQGMEVYACPEHPEGDCSQKCIYLQDYLKRFNATAPRPNSGEGRRAISLSAFGDPEDKTSHET